MFGIKVFPGFSLQTPRTQCDTDFLECLLAAKQATKAQYVNFAVFDYSETTPETKHYLTYPMGWISYYIRHGFQELDPLLSFDYRRISFIDWKDFWRSEREIEFFKASHDHGIGENGVVIVSHLGEQTYGALSLIYDQRNDDWQNFRNQMMAQMRLQCDRVGECQQQLYANRAAKPYQLTAREIECLYWVAIGNTDEQIASLMGIGRWTVVGHVKSAKFKLDCPNRTAAVARAISCGLLDIRKAV